MKRPAKARNARCVTGLILAALISTACDAGPEPGRRGGRSGPSLQETATPPEAAAREQRQVETIRTPAPTGEGHALAARPADQLEILGPVSHESLQVYVVRDPSTRRAERPVMSLEAALEKQLAVVRETGRVEELTIQNLSKDHDIYIQSGDIVRGGKQDRVLAKGLVISPGSEPVALASFCVEQGRWAWRSETPQTEGQPIPSGRFVSSTNYAGGRQLSAAIRGRRSQQEVWNAVSEAQAKLGQKLNTVVAAASSASSLELTLSHKHVQAATGAYEKALGQALDAHPKANGVVFVIGGRLHSADLYHNPDLLRALWPKLLRAAAVEAITAGDAVAPPKALDAAAIRARLAIRAGRPGTRQDLNERTRYLSSTGPGDLFAECQDRREGHSWIHRSYLFDADPSPAGASGRSR